MSLREIKKRNRRKYDSLLRLAKQNDLTLEQCVELLRRINEFKRLRRMTKRYGEYVAWSEMERDPDFMWTAPIYICGKQEISGYRGILNKQDLPIEYQHLWEDEKND